jgi:RNA polymerase sigma factor for flagellar operon FliA
MSINDTWLEYRTTKNKNVRQELILSYLWLVKHIAGRIELKYPSKLQLDDLEGYGIVGLIDAIEKYDPGKGVQFEFYATTRIRGSMVDEIRKQNWIPRSTWVKLKNYFAVKEKMEKEMSGEVTEEKLASALKITTAELRRLTTHLSKYSIASLDEINGCNEENTSYKIYNLEDHSSPDPLDFVEKNENRAILINAIQQLNEKDKLVLSLYYQEELTLKEIGKIMDISESRVCQLHTRAIKRLRQTFEEMLNGRTDKIAGDSKNVAGRVELTDGSYSGPGS